MLSEKPELSFTNVLVSSDLVGSGDFRAEVGGWVSVALAAVSHHWDYVTGDDRQLHITHGTAGKGLQTQTTLTGTVLPFEGADGIGGWVLDHSGIPIHVTSDDDREQHPIAGSWVRLRATINIADDHVVDEVQPTLQLPMVQPWRVHRITRLVPASGPGQARLLAQPAQAVHHTTDAGIYLVDLMR